MPKRAWWVLLTLLILLSGEASAAEWAEYKSENFTLYSDVAEPAALEVLNNFEQFRFATLTFLGLPDTPESERLLIVAYDRGRDYNKIRPSSNVTGFFYHSVFGPRMIIGAKGLTSDFQATLFHEYVHYLMNHHSVNNFPRWYSEGFATLLSSARIDESSIVIGNAPPDYLRAISLDFEASVDSIIDMEYDGTAYDFYLTSWLLTHYLLLDAENAPRRRESFLDYLSRYDTGEDPVDAFPESFGITPSEMQRELELYGRRHALTVATLPRKPDTATVSRRVLSDGEDLYRLGDIAVERDVYSAAYEYFDAFEEEYGDSAFAEKVVSRRAIAYIHEGRVDEADALIEPLLSLEIDDADILADIAHYSYDRYLEAKDESSDAADVYLTRSVNYGARAVELNGGDVEALFYLGSAYDAAGQLQLAADTFLKSYDINPMAPALNLALIHIMLKGNQPEIASYLVSRLYSANHSEEGRARLLQLKEDIDSGNMDSELIQQLL